MTNKLIIYEPEETTNLVRNPRLTDGVDGYFDSGSTILRILNRARWGRASLEVTTDGVGLQEGAYYRLDPQTRDTFYAASAYVRGEGQVRIRLRDASNGIEFGGPATGLNDNGWTRLTVVGKTGGAVSNDLRLYVETIGSIQGVVFYIDGLQIEAKSYVTTYADGDLEAELPAHDGNPYFRWTGTRNASASTRSDRFRPAGRPRVLEFDDVGVYVTQGSGLGFPPVRLNLQSLAGQNRTLVQNFRIEPRVIQMAFWAKKDPRTRVERPASLRELHLLRQQLEALIKPDRTHGAQPFRMQYVDGADSLDVLAYYESGLEFDGDLRFPYLNSFPLRLLGADPLWIADSQDTYLLTGSQEIANSAGIVARIDGTWQALGTGAAGSSTNGVRGMAMDRWGRIYVVGTFTSMGGVANTLGIARWNGLEWEACDAGLDDGSAFAVAIGSDDQVYVGGTFTDASGVTCDNILRYDPASDTIFPLDANPDGGVDAGVFAVAVDRDGLVYFGGTFDQTQNGGTINSVAVYDPDTDLILAVGNGLEHSAGGEFVSGLTVDLDGVTVMVSGFFDREPGGLAGDLRGVALYDPSTNSFTEPGDDGANNDDVRQTALAPDGRFYVAGFFTNIGVVDAEKVAVYTRQEWLPLGAEGDGAIGGVSGIGRTVAVSRKNRVYFGGDFDSMTGAPFARLLGSWNGSSFSHMDLELPGAANQVRALLTYGDDLYVGHNIESVAVQASTIQTITNRGKAAVGPVLEVLGPARLLWLENQTTGHVLRMDLTVIDNEFVIIDLRPGMFRALSNFRGTVADGILRDSDLTDFRLIPGDNRIAFFARETGAATEMVLRWEIQHWSFDDIAWAQATD